MSNDRADETGLAKLVEGLPVEQRTALDLILAGKSMAASAEAAGVSRQTVHRWLRQEPAFQAAYNQWHEELKANSRSRLLMLTEKATAALERALERHDEKTALQLLKGLGVLAASPKALTDAEEIREQAEIDKRRQAANRQSDRNRLDKDEKIVGIGRK